MNFENTIIVMTSNAGSATKEGTVGFDRSLSQQDSEKAMKALQQFLRPAGRRKVPGFYQKSQTRLKASVGRRVRFRRRR